MGADHIERLARRTVGAEISVVVDADVSRARKAVEAIPSAVAVSNIEQALDREDVDAVVIATPGFLHKTFLGGVAANTPFPVNAIDGLRTAYLAEAAGASKKRRKEI